MGGSAVTSLWLILPCVVVLGFSSEEQKIITAKPGDTVILPCQTANNIKVVEWSRPDLKPECVILYRNKQCDPLSQNPVFKNRVEMKMNDGNVTLTLKNVTTVDSGTYECRILTNRKKRAVEPVRIVHLHVVDPPGQTGGHTEDGGKEDGSVGLRRGHFPLIASLSFICVVCILTTILTKYFYPTRDKATDTQLA